MRVFFVLGMVLVLDAVLIYTVDPDEEYKNRYEGPILYKLRRFIGWRRLLIAGMILIALSLPFWLVGQVA